MNDADAAARGVRAKAAWDEVAPILDNIERDYSDKIIAIASTELDPKVRTEKLTALSIALRIAKNVRQGLDVAIRDGEIAEKSLIRVEHIERMAEPKRRLLGIAPIR